MKAVFLVPRLIIHFCVLLLYPQMYLVIFPEGTRYNPELKNVIAESQAFAAKEGTSREAAFCCGSSHAYYFSLISLNHLSQLIM